MKLKHKVAYLTTCDVFAGCSSSKRLKVGAVIVKNNRIISCGYNALPEHLYGPLEDENNVTLPEVRHGEKSALMGLTKSSESAPGSVMFCSHSCCRPCAVDIADAGIKAFYFRDVYKNWEGLIHLLDVGVKVYKWEEAYQQFREIINLGGSHVTTLA